MTPGANQFAQMQVLPRDVKIGDPTKRDRKLREQVPLLLQVTCIFEVSKHQASYDPGCYRGLRHRVVASRSGGQRTNARTRKGPRGPIVQTLQAKVRPLQR